MFWYDHRHSCVRPVYRDIVFEILRLLNYPYARARRYLPWRASRNGLVKLHVGSGRFYAEGWINVDINPWYRKELWLDLRNPWPFADGQVDLIFSMHTFEHFDPIDLDFVLAECYRVLKHRGGIRVAVPDLERAIAAYNSGVFDHVRYVDPASTSKGRKFNDAIVYHGQHKILFDSGYLCELLAEVGFREPRQCHFRQSALLDADDLAILEREDHSDDLFVETYK